MSGIYIHIPYCKQACHYCDFHFSTNRNTQSDLVKAIITELINRKRELVEEPISSIYFGGGTPSLLTDRELDALLTATSRHFLWAEDIEITLEANPDDIQKDRLKFWKSAGVNRLSIGVQSFSDDHLKWMNRAHSAIEAKRAMDWSLDADFVTSSIDLIYGIPGLSFSDWVRDVKYVLQSGFKHLSAYQLTIEAKTVLAHQIAKGAPAPVDKQVSEQFVELMNLIREGAWNHYEISNYSKPGFEAKHNTNYWKRKPYLGLGPSAHSFDGVIRRWNVPNNHKYLSGILNKEVYWEEERLSRKDRINEFIMLGLRRNVGLDCNQLWQEEQFDLKSERVKELTSILNQGWAKWAEDTLILTQVGIHFADKIASDLFETD
jgi:oxygen-independent coproporphyrinogen-3 oxidase